VARCLKSANSQLKWKNRPKARDIERVFDPSQDISQWPPQAAAGSMMEAGK
jgi:hypothetical protein